MKQRRFSVLQNTPQIYKPLFIHNDGNHLLLLKLPISLFFFLQLSTKKSERIQNRSFSFMNPLAVEIWFYIAFAYMLVSMTIWIVARFSPFEWQTNKPTCPMASSTSRTTSYYKGLDAETHICDCDALEMANTQYCSQPGHFEETISQFGTSEDYLQKDDRREENEESFCDNIHNHEVTAELISIENDFTLTNSFWFAVGTLMQQGSDLNPQVLFFFYFYFAYASGRVILE